MRGLPGVVPRLAQDQDINCNNSESKGGRAQWFRLSPAVSLNKTPVSPWAPPRTLAVASRQDNSCTPQSSPVKCHCPHPLFYSSFP